MREVHFTLPELALLVGTRAALGVGRRPLTGGLPSDEPTQGGWVDTLLGGCRDHRPARVRNARESPPLAPSLVAMRAAVGVCSRLNQPQTHASNPT